MDIHKKKGKNKKCRFGITLPVMKNTRILTPLTPDEEALRERGKELYVRIQKLMQYFYKNPEVKSFEEILEMLECSETHYIDAIRSSLKQNKVFFCVVVVLKLA